MFGFAAGRNVQVGLIAQDARSLNWIVLVVLTQLLQAVESFLVDQEPLLDPAFDATGGANTGKTPVAIEDLDALAILDVADAVIDGGNLVAQGSLGRRNIGYLEHAVTSAAAGVDRCYQRHQREQRSETAG
jgi:hypothetical protein